MNTNTNEPRRPAIPETMQQDFLRMVEHLKTQGLNEGEAQARAREMMQNALKQNQEDEKKALRDAAKAARRRWEEARTQYRDAFISELRKSNNNQEVIAILLADIASSLKDICYGGILDRRAPSRLAFKNSQSSNKNNKYERK